MKLLLKNIVGFLIICYSIYIMGATIKSLTHIQKTNNYNRCVSVMSAAKATGKISRNTDINKECNYHLERL